MRHSPLQGGTGGRSPSCQEVLRVDTPPGCLAPAAGPSRQPACPTWAGLRATSCSPQAPEGDLRAAEPAEAGDRGAVPPPGQAPAPQRGALPHSAPCRPPQEDQPEPAEGWEAPQPAGAAAQGRGLQHRSGPCLVSRGRAGGSPGQARSARLGVSLERGSREGQTTSVLRAPCQQRAPHPVLSAQCSCHFSQAGGCHCWGAAPSMQRPALQAPAAASCAAVLSLPGCTQGGPHAAHTESQARVRGGPCGCWAVAPTVSVLATWSRHGRSSCSWYSPPPPGASTAPPVSQPGAGRRPRQAAGPPVGLIPDVPPSPQVTCQTAAETLLPRTLLEPVQGPRQPPPQSPVGRRFRPVSLAPSGPPCPRTSAPA